MSASILQLKPDSSQKDRMSDGEVIEMKNSRYNIKVSNKGKKKQKRITSMTESMPGLHGIVHNRPLRVLFLSADTGGGHRASAESLANQVLSPNH